MYMVKVCIILFIEQSFDGWTILNAFNRLCCAFKYTLPLYYSQSHVTQWCKQYCDEHWYGESHNWNGLLNEHLLFNLLKSSSYYSPINIGLLKFLANKSGLTNFMNSVKNYEQEFSCTKIKDLHFIREITVDGNISISESTLVVNTLLEHQVTVGQLWNFCTPRLTNIVYGDEFIITNAETLILDASQPLLQFYNSAKVIV